MKISALILLSITCIGIGAVGGFLARKSIGRGIDATQITPLPLKPTDHQLARMENELVQIEKNVDSRFGTIESQLLKLSHEYSDFNSNKNQDIKPIDSQAVAVASKPWMPVLTNGTYALENNAIVYDDDSRIQLSPQMTVIPSKGGVMVSDVSQKLVNGDLVVERPEGSLATSGASLSVATKTLTSDTATFTPSTPPQNGHP
jgi:hypothetical protein